MRPQSSVGDSALVVTHAMLRRLTSWRCIIIIIIIIIGLDKKAPPGSQSVLTYPQYHGPYYITDVVQRGSIGVAYKLINVDTGKVLKCVISADRLKRYRTLRMIDVR